MEKAYEEWIERKGLWIRRLAGESPDTSLDMRAVAQRLGLRVVIPSEIPGLAQNVVSHLLDRGGAEWSGGGASRPEKGSVIVIEPGYSAAPNASTIPAAAFHHKLNHKLTR